MSTRSWQRAILISGFLLIGLTIQPLHAAELVNGDFEAGLTGWMVDGAVTVDATDQNDAAVFAENPQGAKSTIYQVFDLPPHAMSLSFEYYVLWYEQPATAGGDAAADEETPGVAAGESTDGAGRPAYRHPPPGGTYPLGDFPRDSFSAFLLDPDTVERLLPPPQVPPVEFDDFFYAENTGLVQFNEDYVTVSEPDENQLRTVTLDVSSLPPGRSVRLEFGLAGGPDGYTTMAFVDNVTIQLNTPVAQCADVELPVDAACCATVFVADIDDGSHDPNGPEDIASLCITEVIDQPDETYGQPPPCLAAIDLCDPGEHAVELTITDLAGESDTCSATVTLVDETRPVLTCPEDVEVTAGSDARVPVTEIELIATAEDNCAAEVELSDDRPEDSFPVGDTEVTFTATDAAGNTSTCTVGVTVIQGGGGGGGGGLTEPLEITCPDDVNIECGEPTDPDAAGEAHATSGTRVSNISYEDVQEPGSGKTITIVTRTWSARDAYGRHETCDQIITVEDQTSPVITECPDGRLEADCEGPCADGVPVDDVMITEPMIRDGCSDEPEWICSLPDTAYPVGETLVICTATDDVGNEASCAVVVAIASRSDDSSPTDPDAEQQLPDGNTVDTQYHEEIRITTTRGPCGVGSLAGVLMSVLGLGLMRIRSTRRRTS